MATSFILNNERFTHLLDLRQSLLSLSTKETQVFCKQYLFSSLNNDNKLLTEILFNGMHKLLFEIDINIIKNMKQLLLKQNQSKSTKRILQNQSQHQNNAIDLKCL